MNTRLKVSIVFAAAAMLVCLGSSLFLGLDWTFVHFNSIGSFFRFAALPTLAAFGIAFLFAPKLIRNGERLLDLTLGTAQIVLVTHLVYCVALGILAYFDSPASTIADTISGIVAFGVLALVVVGPAFLFTIIFLPILLRFWIVKSRPAQ